MLPVQPEGLTYVMGVDPVTASEFREHVKTTVKPLKEDPVTKGAPNKVVARALALTALEYSQKARGGGIPTRLTPYVFPKSSGQSSDSSTESPNSFKRYLEEERSRYESEKMDDMETFREWEDGFESFLEGNMRNYIHSSVAEDHESNFRLWYSVNRAQVTV